LSVAQLLLGMQQQRKRQQQQQHSCGCGVNAQWRLAPAAFTQRSSSYSQP
jgi:hypothetical protein